MSIDTGPLLSKSLRASGDLDVLGTCRALGNLPAIRAGSATAFVTSDGLFIGPSEVPPVERQVPRVLQPSPSRRRSWSATRTASPNGNRGRGVCRIRVRVAWRASGSNLVGDVQAARRLLLDDGAAFALAGSTASTRSG